MSVEPDRGLDLTTLKSQPELKIRVAHLTNWATKVPPRILLSLKSWFEITSSSKATPSPLLPSPLPNFIFFPALVQLDVILFIA